MSVAVVSCHIPREGFCVARSTEMGITRASDSGTSDEFGTHAFLYHKLPPQRVSCGMKTDDMLNTTSNTLTKGTGQFPKMVEADIRQWLQTYVISGNKLYHNELDLQVDLTIYLRGLPGRYDDVQTEYFIDKNTAAKKKPDFKKWNVWDSDMSLDIVLRRGNEWFIIEMKYKTRALTEDEKNSLGESFNNRFGVPFDFNLKTHSAYNFNMYDFWKDVRRIEIVKHLFPNVVGGIALFITNDLYYPKGPKAGVGCSNFSMKHGEMHGPDMSWKAGSANDSNKGKHANFTLDRAYYTAWNSGKETPTASIFQYLMLQV